LNGFLYSQQIKETSDRIIQTAKNLVDQNIMVYTFSYIGFNESIPSSDTIEVQFLGKEIDHILEVFTNTEGITECSYDNATGTFTVVADVKADLTQVLVAINNN
jgi:hypothetical protein